MHERAKLNPAEIPQLLEQFNGELSFKIENNPYFIYRPAKRKAKEVLPMMEHTEQLLRQILSFSER